MWIDLSPPSHNFTHFCAPLWEQDGGAGLPLGFTPPLAPKESSQLAGMSVADVSNHSQKTGICFTLILKEVKSLFRITQLSDFKGREQTACATILLYSLPVICGVASAPGVRE